MQLRYGYKYNVDLCAVRVKVMLLLLRVLEDYGLKLNQAQQLTSMPK